MPTIALKKSLQRRRAKRDSLWPDADAVVFPTASGGWSQVPRTLPMIASLIDDLGKKDNAGRVYMVLWGHAYGDGFVEIPDPLQVALEAGYVTSRAERTFSERVATLRDLGFIRTSSVGLREFAFLLLLDPHPVVKQIRRDRPQAIPDPWWSAFLARCSAVGITLPEEPLPAHA